MTVTTTTATATATKEGMADKTADIAIATTSFTTTTTTTTTASKSSSMYPLETTTTPMNDEDHQNVALAEKSFDDDICEVKYSISGCNRNDNENDNDNDDNNSNSNSNSNSSIELDTNTKIKISKLLILNNIVFVIGSIFYVADDCMPYGGLYNDGTLSNNSTTLSPAAMVANSTGDYDDAWSDDNIALKTNQWISTYTILYTIASIAFVITGFLDLLLLKIIRTAYYEKLVPTAAAASSSSPSHNLVVANNNDITTNTTTTTTTNSVVNCVIKVRNWCSNNSDTLIAYSMILAGFFGFLSSLFSVHNYQLSDTLNWFSVTLFFIQSILMIYSRFWGTEQNGINDNDNDDKQQGPIIFWILLVADFFFFYGAASDFGIALNDEFYRYTEVVYDDDDDQPEAIADLTGCVSWLVCSLLYLFVSIYEYHHQTSIII